MPQVLEPHTYNGRQLRLLDFAKDVYSQNGEDGIIAKILEILPTRDHWCVEFGAWDGVYYSNTRELILTQNYSAILIEPVKSRFEKLKQNYRENPRVSTINSFVGFTEKENLDHILRQTPIPKDFDLLTVDIEGNDHHIWRVMSEYRPKVVHLPYNPTIPTEVDFVQAADPNVSQGPSLRGLCRLARDKGYELVCVNYNGAFFVRAELFPFFNIPNNDPRILREHYAAVTYLFTGYDGTIFVQGREMLLHHGVRIENRIRQLPLAFRSYPHNWTMVRWFFFRIYRRLNRILGWC